MRRLPLLFPRARDVLYIRADRGDDEARKLAAAHRLDSGSRDSVSRLAAARA